MDKKQYKFCEEICDLSNGSNKNIHCNFLEYIILMERNVYCCMFGVNIYIQSLKDRNIINDYKIIDNNIYIEDKNCTQNNEKCCCICAGTVYINGKLQECNIKKEHGCCEEFQKLCW